MNAVYWEKWQEAVKWLRTRYEALAVRERWMVLSVCLAVSYLFFEVAIAYQLDNLVAIKKSLKAQQTTLINNEVSLVGLVSKVDDYEKTGSSVLAAKTAQRDEAASALKAQLATLIDPSGLFAVSHRLLEANKGIGVTAIKTYKLSEPEPQPQQAEQDGEPLNLIEHGIDVVLTGSYFDVLDYFSKLDKVPQTILYKRLKLSLGTYPTNDVTVSLSTLTLANEKRVIE